MEEEVLHKLDDDLKKYFPDFDFKLKDFQKKVISNVIEHGNTLCIMPTGGGKSLIYWMSALELGGISIVVSPLTALRRSDSISRRKTSDWHILIMRTRMKISLLTRKLHP